MGHAPRCDMQGHAAEPSVCEARSVKRCIPGRPATGAVCDDVPPLTQSRVMMKANLNLMSDCRLMMRNVCERNPCPLWLAMACVMVCATKLQTCKTQVCHHDTIDM